MEFLTKKVENVSVRVFDERDELGAAAAKDAAARIRAIIEKKGMANLIFAAAPSQDDLLCHLLEEDIDWKKVRAFHQDEYVGISDAEPAGFGNYLRRAIYDHVTMGENYYLFCDEEKSEEKCREYAELLRKYPPDLIFLGIGENGHLAFNDPCVADFNDPEMVKIVELDQVCRQQQVNDGCFQSLDAVPKKAMTMTMSLIKSVPEAICCVPTIRKADAVQKALEGPVDESCPASILRIHSDAVLYLDRESASKVLSYIE